jgi:uncharacterized protein (UPF0335 family)
MATRKLGCIHMYVMQIRPKNYIIPQGIIKLYQLLEKKSRFENKIKHLKSIDQSSKGKGYDGKSFKKKMEILQENTKKNGKENFNGTLKPITMGCRQFVFHPKLLDPKFMPFLLTTHRVGTKNLGLS